MKKSWMVNCVEHFSNCSFKGSCLKGSLVGIYDSEEAARTAVKLHIETWRKAHCNEGVEVDFDKMAAWFDYDSSDGSRWFITQIETP